MKFPVRLVPVTGICLHYIWHLMYGKNIPPGIQELHVVSFSFPRFFMIPNKRAAIYKYLLMHALHMRVPIC